jgi:predicted MFS family arabinose efflux permease
VSQPLFSRAFVALALADLAYFTGIGVVVYALPLHVTGPVGSDEAGAGLAFGAFGITALLCRPLAGRLADRRGRLPLLVGGALLCALSSWLLVLTGSLAAVVALRLLQGVAEAAFFVASFAALVDLAPEDRLGEAISYNSLGLYLGLSVGPPVGELLVRQGGFSAGWAGAGLLAGLAAVLCLAIGETRPTHHEEEDGHGRLLHLAAVPVGLGFLASLVAAGGFIAFATLHAVEIGLESTSLGLLVYGGVVVVGRVAFATVPDRLPSLPVAAASLGVIAFGLVLAAAWPHPVGFLAGAALMGLGVTFSTPALFAAIFATTRPSERGAASGTASAFIDLGIGLGPILLGLVARSAGIPWAFAAGAAICGAGALWMLVLAAHRRAAPALGQ